MYNNNEIITNIRCQKKKDTWAEYSKLVLKELERLNDNHERMRSDFDNRFNEINTKLSEVKTLEKTYNNINWIDKVNEVWSPSQMKEAKNEIYRQKKYNSRSNRYNNICPNNHRYWDINLESSLEIRVLTSWFILLYLYINQLI
jgi:hypothetical protein